MTCLFEPFRIGPLTVRNRILRAATHEGMADPAGNPSADLAALYRRLSEAGVGGLITGCVAVAEDGKTLPGMCVLDTDQRVARWRAALGPAFTADSAPVVAQLVHGGGQAIGPRPAAPSRRRFRPFGQRAETMSEEQIERTIRAFADAVCRARDIGFAGVQLHAAHGYLLAQFLSRRYNRRTDRWGGNPAARFRILGEIIARVQRQAPGFPLLAKISAYSFSPGDNDVEDAVRIAILLEEAGCCAVEVSCGSGEDGFSTIRCPRLPADAIVKLMSRFRRMPVPARVLVRLCVPLVVRLRRPLHNYNVTAARRVKDALRIPVIVTGGIRTLSDMERIVRNGDADCVALSRPFIAEPDFVHRLRSGQLRSRCTDCCWCMIGAIEHPLRCYQTPTNTPTVQCSRIRYKDMAETGHRCHHP